MKNVIRGETHHNGQRHLRCLQHTVKVIGLHGEASGSSISAPERAIFQLDICAPTVTNTLFTCIRGERKSDKRRRSTPQIP